MGTVRSQEGNGRGAVKVYCVGMTPGCRAESIGSRVWGRPGSAARPERRREGGEMVVACVAVLQKGAPWREAGKEGDKSVQGATRVDDRIDDSRCQHFFAIHPDLAVGSDEPVDRLSGFSTDLLGTSHSLCMNELGPDSPRDLSW